MSYNPVTGVTSMFDANKVVENYEGKTPIYNSLGQPILGAQTSKEAMELAGLNWEIQQESIYVGDGSVIDGYVANVRSDTRDVMGIVTPRYKPVQNADAFAFVDELLGNGVRFETAGCLHDGKRVWMLAKMENNDYKLAGDEVIPYLLVSNNHDGKGSVSVALTLTRVWCQNTLNMALKNAKRTWSTSHSGDVNAKIEDARQTLELTNRYMEEMQAQAEKLAQISIPDDFMRKMSEYLFVYDEEKDAKRTIENMKNSRDLLCKIYSEQDDIKKFKGTAWGAYLAITDFNSHVKPGRVTATANENKFLSMCDGAKSDFATRAMVHMKEELGL